MRNNIDKGWVLIPAHNEEASLPLVLQSVRFVCSNRILVVDSCSTDGTAAVARAHGAVVISAAQIGYWHALQTGYRFLLEDSKCQWMVQLDADGQHHPVHIARLQSHLSLHHEHPQWIVGSRAGCGCSGESVLQVGQHLLKWWCVLRLRYSFTDISSGMWCLNRAAMVLLSTYQSPNSTADVAIRFFAAQRGLYPTEIPVAMSHRQSGQSMHHGVSQRLRHLRAIVQDVEFLTRTH
jgi:glycosyltransferase involved in cell wall biosynthesis